MKPYDAAAGPEMNPDAVVFLSTRAPWPPVTGHFIRTFRTMQALAKVRPVHFVGFYDKNLDEHAKRRVREELGKICESICIEDVASEQGEVALLLGLLASMFKLKPFVAVKYSSQVLKQRIRKLLSLYPNAVVWADMLPLCEYLADVPPESAILTMHNIESTRLRRLAQGKASWPIRLGLSLQAALLDAYERRWLPRVRRCIAVSDEDAQVLRGLAPNCQVTVVPNGAELQRHPVGWGSEDRPTVIWVGGMRDPYNRDAVDHFCRDMLPELVRRVPGFQWLVVGGEPSGVVEAARESYPDAVQVLGFVDDLEAQYRRAHLVVIPLRSGAGTKLKVLEAMSFGLAIVTTPVGAEGLGARDGEELSIAASPAEFINRVCALLNDPGLARKQARSAYELVAQRFQWPRIEEILQIELLGIAASEKAGTPE